MWASRAFWQLDIAFLASVLGIVFVAQDAPAYTQDQTAVPRHDGCESGLIEARDKPFQQLPVWEFPGPLRSGHTPHVSNHLIKLTVAHDRYTTAP